MSNRAPMMPDFHSEENQMTLPQGKTCGDCYHFPRCNAIFGHIAEDRVCDWAPSRFFQNPRLNQPIGANNANQA